ncbi:MAG TPA: hypothetical protein VI953_03665 [Candidatus Paceibacterota bacterium]
MSILNKDSTLGQAEAIREIAERLEKAAAGGVTRLESQGIRVSAKAEPFIIGRGTPPHQTGPSEGWRHWVEVPGQPFAEFRDKSGWQRLVRVEGGAVMVYFFYGDPSNRNSGGIKFLSEEKISGHIQWLLDQGYEPRT